MPTGEAETVRERQKAKIMEAVEARMLRYLKMDVIKIARDSDRLRD